jgi:hypothetical protein
MRPEVGGHRRLGRGLACGGSQVCRLDGGGGLEGLDAVGQIGDGRLLLAGSLGADAEGPLSPAGFAAASGL